MNTNNENYEYLLRLYSIVDEFLANNPDRQDLAEVIVAFCIVTEKVLKIRLHGENKLLIYDLGKFKEPDAMVAVLKGKDTSIETIRINEVLKRYFLIFESEFTEDEVQVLTDLYDARNHFVHSQKSDNSLLLDEENLIKKMGTVWEKISSQAVTLFGTAAIKASKPKKKYSEKELEKVLTEEVRTKIKSTDNAYGVYGTMPFGASIYGRAHTTAFSLNNEECPRCGSYAFALEESAPFGVSTMTTMGIYDSNPMSSSDLFKCSKCNLELTKKEYQIAKKLRRNQYGYTE